LLFYVPNNYAERTMFYVLCFISPQHQHHNLTQEDVTRKEKEERSV